MSTWGRVGREGRAGTDRPGLDRKAVRHAAPAGAPRLSSERHVIVVGGGIAGLAAAAGLVERGARVTLVERDDRLGGRVSSWQLDDERTMSRGFHAFFRQYYNLRALLRRVDPLASQLTHIADYPLVRSDGMRDSFTRIPKTPPFNVMGFVAQSPSFTLASLARVDVAAALELLKVRFPDTFYDYEGESAAEFLDRLRFPQAARDLALEVFARSFFADPNNFSAGELVAMFHSYFLGSAEGLLFDVPVDDYDSCLWAPLGAYLERLGVDVRTATTVEHIDVRDDGVTVRLHAADATPREDTTADVGDTLRGDALVLATDPRAARSLIASMSAPVTSAAGERWRENVARTTNAPPFAVVRLWFDGLVDESRPAFLGTSRFGPLDNVSVLERFERGAARWSREHGGSVVELHAYSCGPDVLDGASEIIRELERQLHLVFPETERLGVVHREVLVRDDCGLIGPHEWRDRTSVSTPWPNLVVAGDWVRSSYPVALMERAATTGFLAANRVLSSWGVAGLELWTTPMRGMLASRSSRSVVHDVTIKPG